MKFFFLSLILAFFCLSILTLALRGNIGNPTIDELNQNYWKDDGPLELSPERGRYALTYSVLEDKSVHFSLPVARFATPDLGYKDGNFVSLFAPGVSFIIMPGYILGKYFNLAQVGTFSVIAFIAVLNVFFIRAISKKLGAGDVASIIASFIFLFATPAFAYSISLYQHHIATFLVLSALYILLRWNNLWSLSLIWFLCAASIPIDYPNLFLMIPIGITALGRILLLKKREDSIKLKIRFLGFITFLSVLFPLAFFIWFNQNSYQNPFQFSGTVSSVKAIDDQGKPAAPIGTDVQSQERFINPQRQEKSVFIFFKSRNILNGLNTHFTSPDRGVLLYTPVILLGIFGIYRCYKKYPEMTVTLIGIIGFNVLLYSMWNDPYGGWAFGSRYLIPSYSIMSIFLALALNKLRKNYIFLIIFLILSVYSIGVNTLGAITSNRNPPKVEAVELQKISNIEEKYTYERNWDYLKSGKSKSYMFTNFASRYLTAVQYYILLSGLIIAPVLILTMVIALKRSKVGE